MKPLHLFSLWLLVLISLSYSQGPVATPIVPQPGEWAGCADQQILIRITDPQGVNTSTITLSVNGRIYFFPDHLTYIGDTLRFTPTTPFRNGDTVRVALLEAQDNLGNPLSSPLSYDFYIDLDYPFISYHTPPTGAIVRWTHPDVGVVIRDTTSGMAFGSVCFCFNVGTFRCDSTGASGWCEGSDGIEWIGDTLFFHTSILPYYFTEEGVITACINHGVDLVSSNPRLCGPHSVTHSGLYCWDFTIDTLPPRATLIFPGFGDWVACDSIVIRTVDLSGVDTTKIQLRVGTYSFYVHQDFYAWVRGNDIFYVPPTPFSNGDSIAVRILRLEDMLGNRAYSGSFPPWYFKIDKLPPYIVDVFPDSGSTVAQSSPIITIDIADLNSGVLPDSIIVTINGTPFNTTAPPVRWSSGRLTVNTGGLGYVFSDGDTVRVCITRAIDRVLPENCGPNRMNPYCFFFVIDLRGPDVSLIRPFNWAFVACPNESIFFAITDLSGIDPGSLRLVVEGITYDISNGLQIRNDTLIFVPPSSWAPGDTIDFTLIQARDRLGNNISAPLNYHFITDREPPQILGFTPPPGSAFSDSAPTFAVRVSDRLAGFNQSFSYIVVQGEEFRPPVGFSYAGGNFTFETARRGIHFFNGESLLVCWHLVDNVLAGFCGPNSIDTCVRYSADFQPPSYTLIFPQSGTITACARQEIRILLRDANGIEPSSLRLTVQGVSYSIGPNLGMRGDTLVFVPPVPFNDGDTVRFGLTSYSDMLGNTGSSGIIWYFVMDRTPPYLAGSFPSDGQVIGDRTPTLSLYVSDNLSGVLAESLRISVRGTEYRLGSPGFSWDGTRIRFNTLAAGISFANGETVNVCLTRASDNVSARYCGPNTVTAPVCFRFVVQLSGPTVLLLSPADGSFVGCNFQPVRLLFSHGVIRESTIVVIDSVAYRYPHPTLQFRGDTLIFTPSSAWREGDNVVVHILSAVDSNGIALGTSPYWSFRIDYSPPRIVELYPSPGRVLNDSTPSFRLICQDDISGVDWASFRMTLNGVPLTSASPGVNLIGDSLYLSLSEAGFRFNNGDTIRLCITNLSDRVPSIYCGPNRLVRDSCFTYRVDLLGPVAQIVLPENGATSGCIRQQVRIRIQDASGLNLDSLRLRIAGVYYTRMSSRITFSGDTLIFTPGTDWRNGDSVLIELISIYDIAGNRLQGAPLNWYFRVDLARPVLWGVMPLDLTLTSNPSPIVSFFISDSGIGLDTTSINVRVRGRNYPVGSPGVTFSANQIRFNPALAGLTFTSGDTVRFCAFGADRVSPRYCGPNRSDTLCTRIIFDFSPPVVLPLVPDSNSYTSCSDQAIVAQIYDLYGINRDSLRMIINGISYSVVSPQITYNDSLLTFIPSTPFRNNDTVNISVIALDRVGNRLPSAPTWRFFVDTAPPVISLPNPSPGSVIGAEDTISFRITDSGSGVDWNNVVVDIGGFTFRVGQSGVRRIGDRIYLYIDSLGLSFPTIETVPVCITAPDRARYCGANRVSDVCFNYTFDLQGPLVRMLLPAHNSVSACSTQRIQVVLSDVNGIRRSSVTLRINGTNYTLASPQLSLVDSVLTFTPSTSWANGTIVRVRVASVSDTLGNLTMMDYDWVFGIDLSPPVVVGYHPLNGSISGDATGGIWARINDMGAGVDPSSLRMTVNGVAYDLSNPALSWFGGTLRFDPARAGMSFFDGETVRVSVVAADRPAYCGPNVMSLFSWWFVMDLAGPAVSLIAPPRGYTSSCRRLGARFSLRDISPVDTMSIVVSVNGSLRTIASPDLNYSAGVLYFDPQTDFRDGDTVRVSISQAKDIWGNSANIGSIDTAFYIIDLSPPNVSETFPPNGATSADSVQIIWMRIFDRFSPVDPTFFILDVNGTSYNFGIDSCLSWDGDRLVFRPDLAGISFHNNDTVRVCLTGAADHPDTCYPNYLESPLCSSFRIDMNGPVARIVTPPQGIYYSCPPESQRVLIELTDPDGIVTDSIRFLINHAPVSYGSNLVYHSPYLVYTPPEPWRSGDTVFVELQRAVDVFGNPLQLPLSWSFIVDRSPPVVVATSPVNGASVSTSTPVIRFVIRDSLSGIEPASIVIIINDTTYTVGRGLIFRRDSAYVPAESLRNRFSDGETVRVCLVNVEDRARICGSNRLSEPYCFRFTIELGAPVAYPIFPLPNTFISCPPERQEIRIYLYDRNGVDLNSLDFRVRGVQYRWGSYLLAYRDTNLVFTPLGVPWRSGDTVRVELRTVRDSLGNALLSPLLYSFYVDLTPPFVAFVEPASGGYLGGTRRDIRVRLYDAMAGIDTVSVRVSLQGTEAGIGIRGVDYRDSICTIPIDSFGLTLADGESLRACVLSARDLANFCPPNSLYAPVCIDFRLDLAPPEVRLVRPQPNIFSACIRDSIIFQTNDINGIDTSGIVLVINGISYDIFSPQLNYDRIHNRVVFVGSTPFDNGDTVTFSIYGVADTLGNRMVSGLSSSFFVDQTPPEVSNPSPVGVISDSAPNIILLVRDTGSGVNPSSIRLSINGRIFDLSNPALGYSNDTLIFRTSSAGLHFSDGESVSVCLMSVEDNTLLCGPNRLERPFCFSFVVSLTGPVGNMVEPDAESFVSCPPESQRIVLSLFDPDGVNWRSVVVEVNGVSYPFGAPEWSYSAGLLTFRPSEPFNNGDTIIVRIIAAEDSLGNSILRSYSWRFFFDSEPPTITRISPTPSSTVSSRTPTIEVGIVDNFAGVLRSSARMSVNGVLYNISSPGISWLRDSLVFNPSAVGLTFRGGDTINVCVHIEDSTSLCERNAVDTCFSFRIAGEGPVATVLIPHENEFVSCDSQNVVFQLYAPTGAVDIASIRVIYGTDTLRGGSPYIQYNRSDSTLIVSPIRHYGGGSIVGVRLISATDTLGNALEVPAGVRFVVDVTSPVLAYSSIRNGRRMAVPDSMVFVLADNISGVLDSSVRVQIGSAVFRVGDPGVVLRSDTLIIYSHLAGLTFEEEVPVEVCLFVSDRALYCGHNSLDTCQSFTPTGRPPDVVLIYPEAGSIYSCLTESIVVGITDTDGVMVSSITLQVDDSTMTLPHAGFNFARGRLTFLPYPIEPGESLWVQVLRASDSLGNTIVDAPRWFFIYDPLPPVAQTILPDTIFHLPETLIFVIRDTISGVDFERITISFNGGDFEPLASAGGWVLGDSLFLPVDESLFGDSIIVCVRAFDLVSVCEPNLMDACFVFPLRIIGPRARLIEPLPFSFSSCETGTIKILFTNPTGIIPESLAVRIGGHYYSWGSVAMQFVSDTLFLTPDFSFSEGETVVVELTRACDTLGNSLIRPLRWQFYIDLTPPQLVSSNPPLGSITPYTRPDISMVVADSLSGINWDRFNILIDGVDYTSYANITLNTITIYGDDLINNFRLNDTIDVLLRLCDNAEYCGANCSTYTFYFICGGEGPYLQPLLPLPESFTSCSLQTIAILVSDTDAILWNDLRLFIKGTLYSIDSSQISIRGDTIFFVPEVPFADGESVRVGFSVPDIYRNPPQNTLDYYFVVDLSPPVFDNPVPLGSIANSQSQISVDIYDSGAGVLDSACRFIIIRNPGLPVFDTITVGDAGFTVHGSRFIFDPVEYNAGRVCGENGSIWFFESDSVFVKVIASDKAGYCLPNTDSALWSFFVLDDDTLPPVLVSFEPETVLDSTQCIFSLVLFDSSGIDSAYILWDTDSSLTNGGERTVALVRVDSTNFVTSDPVFAVAGLILRVYAWDADTDCGHNYDRSIMASEDIRPFVVPRTGPIAELVRPGISQISACPYQEITFRITDPDGVDPSTIVFVVEDETLRAYDPRLNFENGFLTYTPLVMWTSGRRVDFALISASDRWGNPLQNPIYGHFISDLTGPVCELLSPVDSSYISRGTSILVSIRDSISRVNPSSIRLEVNGRIFTLASPGISFENDILAISPFELDLPETNSILLNLLSAQDTPDLCPPNDLQRECSFFFRFESEFGCDASPNPFTPNRDAFNPVVRFTYPHIETLPAELLIYDRTGRLIFNKVIQPGGSSSFWDGKTMDGKDAPVGEYIYILVRQGKLLCKGSIVLAR